MDSNHTQFGNALKPKFLIKDSITQFNCGSFGVVPKIILKKRLEYIAQIESLPDYYLKFTLEERLNKTIKRLSSQVGCKQENLVLIDNTMQGINIVLNQFELSEKDLLVHTSLVYTAIKNVLQNLQLKNKIQVKELCIELGQTNLQIKQEVKNFLKRLKTKENLYRKKILLVEGISSIPAMVLPYTEIAQLFKAEGFVVIVDGAHCFGQTKINFEASSADFFIANLYKWGYIFRPSAFLCVRNFNPQDNIRPLSITFNHNNSVLNNRFLWPGTIDFSVWLSINDGLDFRFGLGHDRITNYNHNLCVKGSLLVAKILGSSSFFVGNIDQIGFMSNIRLPYTPNVFENTNFGKDFEQIFLNKYKTLVKLFDYNNSWYVRLSAQIYLELRDYEILGKNLKIELKKSKI